ncbi:MAG: amidohydrolase family protein [Rhodospirillaceae bacterium]|nr:amidohydrolase family protein [Rhodospirillaceae bacterium]
MSIIDADAHVIESERTWDFLEPHEQKYRPIALTGDGGVKHWLVDGQLFSREAGNLDLPIAVRQMEDLEGRAAIMDECGVAKQVLYPTLFLQGMPSKRPEIQVALARSYNRWLADVWRRNNRFLWAIVPPLLDMDSALAELDFGKKNGACAVFMRGIEGEWLLHDPYFAPLYRKAEALDLPICIHAGNGNNAFKDVLFRKDLYFFGITPILAGFNALASSGLQADYKTLRFAFIEAGSQWIPYLVREAARRHEFIGTRGKVSDPATFLRDNRIWVTARTDDDLPYVLKYAGLGSLVLGTDFGHEDPAAELDAFARLRESAGVDRAAIDAIFAANAKALYAI